MIIKNSAPQCVAKQYIVLCTLVSIIIYIREEIAQELKKEKNTNFQNDNIVLHYFLMLYIEHKNLEEKASPFFLEIKS